MAFIRLFKIRVSLLCSHPSFWSYFILFTAFVLYFSLLRTAGIWIFPYLSSNHDEAVYLYQALNLLKGKLFESVDPYSPFFKTWFVKEVGNSLIFKYTPVHALCLALGKYLLGSFNDTRALMGASGVLVFYFFFHEIFRSSRMALGATGIMVLSPIYFILANTYLSYVGFLVLISLALGFLFKGIRTHSSGWRVGGGLLSGLCAFDRPFETVLVMSSFVIAYFLLEKSDPLRTKVSHFGVALLGFLPFAVLILAYNAWITGNCFVFPFKQDPLDTFGFGEKRMEPFGKFTLYDLPAALKVSADSIRKLVEFTFGGYLTAFSAVLFLGRKKDRWNWIHSFIFLILLVIPLGFFFFWGPLCVWRLTDELGPFYHLAMILPLSVFSVEWFASLWNQLKGLKTWQRRFLIFGSLEFLFICTFVKVQSVLELNLYQSELESLKYEPFHQKGITLGPDEPFNFFRKKAEEDRGYLVFVPSVHGPWLLHPFAALINDPGKQAKAVYALDRGVENFKLMDLYPNRKHLRFNFHETDSESLIKTRLEELTLLSEKSKSFEVRIKPLEPYHFTEVGFTHGKKKIVFLVPPPSTGKPRSDIIGFRVSFEIKSGVLRVQSPLNKKISTFKLSNGKELLISLHSKQSKQKKWEKTQVGYQFKLFHRLREQAFDLVWPPESWKLVGRMNPEWVRIELPGESQPISLSPK